MLVFKRFHNLVCKYWGNYHYVTTLFQFSNSEEQLASCLAPRAWQRYGPQMTVVAVMQPYFMPYAGYFRLFAAADLVAIFDCVQFPRRGWVHRNRLPGRNGETQWLTLPLQKATTGTQINNLKFT